MILLVVAGSAVLVVAAVLGFLVLGGGDDEGSAATGVASEFRALGGSFETLPATPNLRYKGQRLRHAPALPPGFKYNSNPPSSGIHTDQTVIWNIYDQPVPAISSVHNLEHGGIVIRYGPDVPASEVEKIREFYLDDPNGMLVAPMPGLGDTIALRGPTTRGARTTERMRARGGSPRSSASTTTHSTRLSTTSAATGPSFSPSPICSRAVPGTALPFPEPGWRNWSYAPDLKSGVPLGGVRVRLPPPACFFSLHSSPRSSGSRLRGGSSPWPRPPCGRCWRSPCSSGTPAGGGDDRRGGASRIDRRGRGGVPAAG